MRFVLDHNVDEAVGREIRKRKHDCWRAPEHLAQDGRDDEISIYAVEKDAVVISHDGEFAARRRAHPIGIHVRLKCSEPDAVEVVRLHFADVIEAISYLGIGVINVSWNGVEPIHP